MSSERTSSGSTLDGFHILNSRELGFLSGSKGRIEETAWCEARKTRTVPFEGWQPNATTSLQPPHPPSLHLAWQFFSCVVAGVEVLFLGDWLCIMNECCRRSFRETINLILLRHDGCESVAIGGKSSAKESALVSFRFLKRGGKELGGTVSPS